MDKTEITQYSKINRTISMGRANLLSVGLIIPVFVLPSILFMWIWGLKQLINGLETLYDRPLILILGFALLVVLHELIHGLTWQWTSGSTWQDVKYGFKWKTLTPYAHLKKPIDIRPYRWGAAMPGILTGLLPLLIGLVIGSGAWLIVGMMMTAAAGGDMMILWLLRKDNSPVLVEDHPSEAGCYILVEKA
jgi:Putative zincin peptidase